jgi:hypothetical protein
MSDVTGSSKMTLSTPTGNVVVIADTPTSSSTSSSQLIIQSTSPTPNATKPMTPDDNIQNAVYAYVQAYRALGNTTISTVRIAKGLGIKPRLVEHAMLALRDKGVMPIHD